MEVKQYHQKYYERNKEKIIERSKLWREKNQEKVKAKIICDCGGHYLATNKTNHTRTKKHLTWIAFQKILEDSKK